MTIKKILLLGATGQIGKELAYECKNNKEIDKFTSFEFALMIQKEIIKLNVT